MKSFLTPLLLIGISAVIFFYGINKEYIKMGELQQEAKLYDEVLIRYQDKNTLETRIDRQLSTVKNTSFLNKIQVALPDGVDNVQLLLELSSLLRKYGQGIDWKNIKLNDTKTSTPAPTTAGGSSIDVGYKDYQLEFSLIGRYQNVLNFLKVLEHNLRLLDIVGLKLTQESNKALAQDSYNFNITLRTYFFNK